MTGTSPEAAAPAAPPAPSSPPEAAPAEATSEPPSPTSLLSQAKADSTAPPPAEQPQAEQQQPEQPQEIPLPTYEAFTMPEGVTLDEKPLGEFTNLLGEYERQLAAPDADRHTATQELGQKLVDLYIAETRANAERYFQNQRDTWTRTREQWLSDFREDPEIGGNRQDTTVARCGAVLELYGQRVGPQQEKALRDVMGVTGAGDNPEILRFINWVSSFVVENARMVPAAAPRAPVFTSRAERMYRRSLGQGAA